jgi:hypothetical protein
MQGIAHAVDPQVAESAAAMNWVMENGTKAIGLLSALVVVLSTVHDWGYFAVIGPDFRALLSAYDYVTNAFEWMPSAILLCIAGAAFARATIFVALEWPNMAGGERTKRWREGLLIFAVLFFCLALLSVAMSLLGTFPLSRSHLLWGFFSLLRRYSIRTSFGLALTMHCDGGSPLH